MELLKAYEWPGNIRELRNIIERAVITSDGSSLHLAEPLHFIHEKSYGYMEETNDEFLPLAEVERLHIQRILQKTNWQVSGRKGAASILKINRSTLRSRIKKMGLKKS